MNPMIIMMVTIIMFCVQVAAYKSLLPRPIRYFLAYYPLFGFLANVGASSLILVFTGVASIVGLGNLGASVLFGVYLSIVRFRLDLRSIRRGLFPKIVPAAELSEAEKNDTRGQ